MPIFNIKLLFSPGGEMYFSDIKLIGFKFKGLMTYRI